MDNAARIVAEFAALVVGQLLAADQSLEVTVRFDAIGRFEQLVVDVAKGPRRWQWRNKVFAILGCTDRAWATTCVVDGALYEMGRS